MVFPALLLPAILNCLLQLVSSESVKKIPATPKGDFDSSFHVFHCQRGNKIMSQSVSHHLLAYRRNKPETELPVKQPRTAGVTDDEEHSKTV